MSESTAAVSSDAPRSIRIAHLSDLHFQTSATDTSWAVWQSIQDYLVKTEKPHLVLITGDLANTPSRKVYKMIEGAVTRLDQAISDLHPPIAVPRVWVCAGNHDRHHFGYALPLVRTSRHFDDRDGLKKYVPRLDRDDIAELKAGANAWRVRLVSVDTSKHVRHSAQAFLPRKEREAIGKLQSDTNAELVIMLFHHHLLPLPAAEKEKPKLFDGFFNFTGAVNPGTILESLAASQVDLVLHGHEHHVNRARYASYEPHAGQVAMIAAGSATGKRTWSGCHVSRATFNMLELRPDRSVWWQQIKGRIEEQGKAEWYRDKDPFELLDPITLRENLFRRTVRQQRQRATSTVEQMGPPSDYIKEFVLTATRDAEVRETRTNLRIDNGRFDVSIQNDTGQPAFPTVTARLRLPPETPDPIETGFRRISDTPNVSNAWTFGITIPTRESVAADWIKTTYLWQDAAIVTEDDWALLDLTKAHVFRNKKKEFVAASIDRPFRSLTLSASFPPGLRPDPLKVVVWTSDDGARYMESHALTERLIFAGQTVILTLPFPRRGYYYAIAWPPPAGPPPSDTATRVWRHPRLKQLAQLIATACLTAFDATQWRDLTSVTVYAPELGSTVPGLILKRIGFAGYNNGDEDVPSVVNRRDPPNAYQSVWWNEEVDFLTQGGETSEQRVAAGMLEHEQAVAYRPLQLRDEAGPPIAVLRIGVSPSAPAPDRAAFEIALALGQARAISSLLQEI